MEGTQYIPTISLCMIVKDEESTLGRCLDSVKDLVDEIIIVDTGSVDKTKEIARTYTDKIYDFTWIDNFAAARNFSFEKASMDYILWLDADDVISESERKKFEKFKELFPEEIDIIFMQYSTAYSSENTSISTRRERLIKRSINCKWIGAVHEVLDYDSKATKILVEIAITHKKEKEFSNRNIKIYEKIMENGEKLAPRDLYHYGKELMAHGYIEKAIDVFEDFLKTPFIDPSFHSAICIDLVDCHYKLENKDQCMFYCLKSFEFDIPRAEITSRLGQLFFEQKKFENSIFWSSMSLQLPLPKGGSPILHSSYTWQPHLTLCSCYSTLNDHEQADYHFQKANESAPNEPILLNYKEQYEKFKASQKEFSQKQEE